MRAPTTLRATKNIHTCTWFPPPPPSSAFHPPSTLCLASHHRLTSPRLAWASYTHTARPGQPSQPSRTPPHTHPSAGPPTRPRVRRLRPRLGGGDSDSLANPQAPFESAQYPARPSPSPWSAPSARSSPGAPPSPRPRSRRRAKSIMVRPLAHPRLRAPASRPPWDKPESAR